LRSPWRISQREVEQISERCAGLKEEKRKVEEELEHQGKILEAVSQEKEEEVRKGAARERRIRALLTEMNELDERLGNGRNSQKSASY
jgi:hypothetical protein